MSRPTVPRVTSRYWPLVDLRLTTPDLVLRPPTESELEALADLLPADVELDPAAPTMPGAPAAAVRGTVLLQSHWRSRGTWRPESWALGLGVFRDGEPIGHQVLEAEDFARLRTVDSSSFLTTAARGQGFGKQMRAAVLALAFGPLGARAALSCAWNDNAASLGVSRSLGYVENGVVPHRRGDGVGEMAHLRLDRAAWVASGWPDRVGVSGVEPCLPWFGAAGSTDH